MTYFISDEDSDDSYGDLESEEEDSDNEIDVMKKHADKKGQTGKAKVKVPDGEGQTVDLQVIYSSVDTAFPLNCLLLTCYGVF